jgi:methylglutaconyl-CoA hydratase
VDHDERGVAMLAMNRPERHNALSSALIEALTEALDVLALDGDTRIVVLAGEGRSFCAGADIDEMRAAGDALPEANAREAARLAALLRQLDTFPKPTVARVQGNAFGGALGLIAACDVAIAAATASFALTEVRLGIVPAMISPYVVRAIGERQARRYFLTGERFAAATAERIGLVHKVVTADQLDASVSSLVTELLAGAPASQAEAKLLVRHVTGRSDADDERLAAETSAWIARLRASTQGREGLSAFLARRLPSWRKE